MVVKIVFFWLFAYFFVAGILMPANSFMGHYLGWVCTIPPVLAKPYASLGKLIVGSSRSRFSLLVVAQTGGGFALIWALFVASFSYPLFGRYFAELKTPELTLATIGTVFLLPAIMFLLARNAARTVVCALCSSSSGNEADTQKKYHRSDEMCYYDGEATKPCRPGRFFWPGFPFEVGNGEQNSGPVAISAERVCSKHCRSYSSEKPGEQCEYTAVCFSKGKGDHRQHSSYTQTSQGNGDLLEWCSFESTRFFGVSSESARYGGNAENRFFPEGKLDVDATKANETRRVVEPLINQEMSYLVKSSMYPRTEKTVSKFRDESKPQETYWNTLNSTEPEYFRGNPKEEGVQEIKSKINHWINTTCLFIFTIIYAMILPIYTVFLLFTALRSRLEGWMTDAHARESKQRAYVILLFLAWALSWIAEACAMGVVAVSVAWILR